MKERILVGLSSAPSGAGINRTAATMAEASGCVCLPTDPVFFRQAQNYHGANNRIRKSIFLLI